MFLRRYTTASVAAVAATRSCALRGSQQPRWCTGPKADGVPAAPSPSPSSPAAASSSSEEAAKPSASAEYVAKLGPGPWGNFWRWTTQERQSHPKFSAAWFLEALIVLGIFSVAGSTTLYAVCGTGGRETRHDVQTHTHIHTQIRPCLTKIGIEGSFIEGPWSYRVASVFMVSPCYTLIVLTGTRTPPTPLCSVAAFCAVAQHGLSPLQLPPHPPPPLLNSRHTGWTPPDVREGCRSHVEEVHAQLCMPTHPTADPLVFRPHNNNNNNNHRHACVCCASLLASSTASKSVRRRAAPFFRPPALSNNYPPPLFAEGGGPLCWHRTDVQSEACAAAVLTNKRTKKKKKKKKAKKELKAARNNKKSEERRR